MSSNLEELQSLFTGSLDDFIDVLRLFSKKNGEERIKAFEEKVLKPLKTIKLGLMVVDYQNDFISGSLSIGNGPARQNPLDALPLINRLVENKNWSVVIYSKDWHPENHISFVERAYDKDRKIMDIYRDTAHAFQHVKFSIPDREQTLFPTHCVQNTWGAELHPQLKVPENAKFVFKGKEKFFESYSSFGEDNKPSEAEDILRDHGVEAVFCLGLAYDICVAFTTHSAVYRGFLSGLVTDASKGLSADQMAVTDKALRSKNVALLDTQTVIDVLERRKIPIEWAYELAIRATA